MQFRNLILVGLGAIIGVASPAWSAPGPAQEKTYLFSKKKDVEEEPAAKATGKTKKLSAKEKAKQAKEAKAKKAEAAREAKAKAAEEKAKLAKAKEEEKKAAKLKAEKEAKIAAAKADKAAKAAAAKAAKEAKAAAAKAEKEAKIAAAKARKEKQLADAAAREKAKREAAEALPPEAIEFAKAGNNGELRSENVAAKPAGFFDQLFGGSVKSASLLPETRALDQAYEKRKQGKKQFQVAAEFMPQSVPFPGYARGTIVIDTANHFLYYVESGSTARRYGIAVGKDGLQYKGEVTVGDKQEWPRWIPTKEMQQRDPKKYGQYKDGMPGGGQNPLGARAMYLYLGKQDTHLRIHGTIAPESIGTNSSNGCFRMVNEHVIDLYKRVKVGTKVIVM